MTYEIIFTKQAKKDYEKIIASPLKPKLGHLLKTLKTNPYQPPYEKLTSWENTYSRRINVQHRLVYEIIEESKQIKILRAWTHYGDN